MSSNGSDIVSQEIANLDINDGARDAFAMYDSAPPPAPKLKSKGVIAMDMTAEFANAAQQLDVGQLVKDPYFTLFESVGALEIMDRKMDSGCLEPGETMEDEYDFSQSLLPEEIIGIIDQLLCHEMAWHMGYPLAQTIFTSLYIDKLLSPCPLSIQQTYFDTRHGSSIHEPLTVRILRAYCLGLIKTCSYINNRVKAEHFYEEEDFVTHTFNRSLLEGIEHDDIFQFLEETTRLLAISDDVSPDVKKALDCRLRFRAQFLETVEVADSSTSDAIAQHWKTLGEFLPFLKSSSKFGKPSPFSFSVKIQRKLASTVPPRPIVQVSQESSFDHLERLCRDAAVAVEVLNYYNSQSLLTFVILFQGRKPQPSVYVRTLLQHYIFADMIMLGDKSIRHILDDDLASTVLPNHKLLDRDNDDIEVPHDLRHQMALRMETFRARAAGSYLDLLRTICQNRCRIRRSLCHTIVDWDTLQLDAEELDVELRDFTMEAPILDQQISTEPIYSFPLSSWAYFYKLKQMEWIVQMGFELETYQQDELAGMYWYLQYLVRTRYRHLERIRGFDVRGFAAARKDPKVPSNKILEYTRAVSFIDFSSMEAAATYGFADSLSSLFTVLSRLSLIKSPPRPYSNDSMRYEVRMKPFLGIGLPELVPFDELTRTIMQPEESNLDLLKFASECAVGAKKGFEVLTKLSAKDAYCQGSHESWLNNIKACLKACIFTSITIASVKKAVEVAGIDGRPKIKIEIPPSGKGYHDWWIVPKVVPVS
ncbi:amino-acid N-acetyltransferase-like protein subunit Mak10 [Mollisia scopiformis]|uniref:Amino-acid N-acetyltransferas-like protein subunit Mak10 n=1 Tax=Mollisia scopiformis TaxID=149040 RepID=A0A132B7V0_MOLSC|nr:amino-acid N-acetyltransferase-like protein subunit Mak10 [Mollisia scopiformis]KUJ08475.1 amino-acid N-acetyltransferas-like protein subunit Mak10 [Mollisia scopiformis]